MVLERKCNQTLHWNKDKVYFSRTPAIIGHGSLSTGEYRSAYGGCGKCIGLYVIRLGICAEGGQYHLTTDAVD